MVDKTVEKEKSIFQIMGTAITKQEMPSNDEIAKINPFLFMRWLSNHPIGVDIANYLNTSQGIPIKAQYLFVRYTMPPKIKYISYPKQEKDNSKEIDIIVKHYDVNRNTAKQYLSIISEEQLKRLMIAYTTLEKVIK